MPTALILNPNTSRSVTDRLLAQAQTLLPPDWRLVPATAAFGAAYIASEAAYAIAGHAVLDAYVREGAGADAVLVGCFGDPGLQALREIATVPVVGLAEAALLEAAQCGRFSIVTGGERWVPILRRLAAGMGLAGQLAGIHVVTESGAALAADPQRALDVLARLCQQAMVSDAPDCLILGGAALAGVGDTLSRSLELPVIDSVSAGMRGLQAALSGARAPRAGPDGVAYERVSPALQAFLTKGELQ